MDKIGLKTAWKGEKQKNQRVFLHNHIYYELVYYLDGFGETNVGEKHYEFCPGSFMVIPKLILHDEIHKTGCKVSVLRFDTTEYLPQFFSLDDTKEVYKIISAILKETKCQPSDYKEMIDVKLNELVLTLRRKSCSNTPQVKDFSYIINYISENYHEKISLYNCAAQLNLSYDWFQHKFKEITGKSPQSFLLNCRLEKAKSLLLEKGLNCSEIAYRCGFSTSAQFSMIFKREHGVSPLEYRKRKN